MGVFADVLVNIERRFILFLQGFEGVKRNVDEIADADVFDDDVSQRGLGDFPGKR